MCCCSAGQEVAMKKVTAIVAGAGQRGRGYCGFATDFPDRLQIVGVAEPQQILRERIVKEHNIAADKVFESWEDAAAVDKFADCVFVTTQDQMHKGPAVSFASKGYHILLEKPMAVTYQDCCDIVEACKSNQIMLQVCHVLRYTPQAKTIKRIIESGAIGDVVNIQHLEPVGFWHFAHSYVRGNWRNLAGSTFSLMAKSCHDIDLIEYWMGEKKCQLISSMGSLKHFKSDQKVGFWHFAHSFVRGNWRNLSQSTFSLLAKCGHDIDLIEYWMEGSTCTAISSMGSLKHFNRENKPEGASDRCLDCKLQNHCPYSAKKIYLDPVKMGYKGFPVKNITPVPDIESVTDVLRNGSYGRCVYDCDNDVMDNQVVTMQYEGGATCTMSMVAFTEKICERQTRVFGTKGELTCDFGTSIVRQFDFSEEAPISHDVMEEVDRAKSSSLGGHGGADFFAMKAFVDAIAMNDPEMILTGPEQSLRSHFLCFAAEKARIDKVVLDLTGDVDVD